MPELLNNIDLDLYRSSSRKSKENKNTIPVEKVLEGEFNMKGSPMFQAELPSEFSKATLGCDEPTSLGGRGVQTTPLTYLLFGVMACYSSTLALECAREGLELRDLRIRGKLSYDLGPVVGDSSNPIITGLKLEVISSTNLEGQIKRAWSRCPAVYAIQNPIKTEISQGEP